MKNPDVKYFIGSDSPSHHCYIHPVKGFKLVTRRKNDLLAKNVMADEAQAYCKRHKIEFPKE